MRLFVEENVKIGFGIWIQRIPMANAISFVHGANNEFPCSMLNVHSAIISFQPFISLNHTIEESRRCS